MPDNLFDVHGQGSAGAVVRRHLEAILQFDGTDVAVRRLGRRLLSEISEGGLAEETVSRLDVFERAEIGVLLRWATERRIVTAGFIPYLTLRLGPGPDALACASIFTLEQRKLLGLDEEQAERVPVIGLSALARIRDREGRDVSTASARIARVILRADLLGNLSRRSTDRIALMSYWEMLAMVDQLATYGLAEPAVLMVYEQTCSRAPVCH